MTNEFASLSQEDLHFLRIFIHTEGHIREMESALGVSYPTVKARLAELKARLRSDLAVTLANASETPPVPPSVPAAQDQRPEASNTSSVLHELEAGNITVEQAIAQLRNRKG